MSHHEIEINRAISRGAEVEFIRSTQVSGEDANGYESRNAQRSHSLRRYNIGYAVREASFIAEIIAFFENRNGRAYTFRFHDHRESQSCAPGETPSETDQLIGTGDGSTRTFQLRKAYTSGRQTYYRPITKPVYGTVLVALNGEITDAYLMNHSSGEIIFDYAPDEDVVITAGFAFSVPVRFEEDRLPTTLIEYEIDGIPEIPLIERRQSPVGLEEAIAFNFPDDDGSIWTEIATNLEGAAA